MINVYNTLPVKVNNINCYWNHYKVNDILIISIAGTFTIII